MSAGTTRDAFASFRQGVRPILCLRWVRVLIVVVAVAVALRATFGFLLARVLDRTLEPQHLACDWDDLDLSIVSGRGEVRALKLTPREAGAEPIAQIDYAVFDVRLWPLFAGDLRIVRLEVDGAELRLERLESGEWNFARHFGGPDEPAPPSPAPSTAGAPAAAEHDRAIVLAPSYSVDELRLQDVYVRLLDRAVAPALDRTFHLDAGVANLFSQSRRTRFSITLTGDRVLDGAHVEGEGEWTPEKIAMDVRVQIGGLRPREMSSYLDLFDASAACDSIQGRATANLAVDVLGEHGDSARVHASVADARVSADGVESLALDRAVIAFDSISGERASLPRFEVAGVRARASIEPSDALRIAGLDLAVQPSPEEGRASDPLEELFALGRGKEVPAWAALLVHHDPKAYPWTLEGVSVRGVELRVADRRVEPAVEIPVLVDEVELGKIVHAAPSTIGAELAPIPVHASVRVPGIAESIRVEGAVAPFAPERSVELSVTVDDMGYDALAGYLHAAGLEPTRERGGLRLHLSGEASTDANGATSGRFELEESLTIAGKEASQLGRVSARDLVFDPAQRRLRFGDVEVAGSRVLFERDPSRRLAAFGMRTLGLRPVSAAPPPDAPRGGPLAESAVAKRRRKATPETGAAQAPVPAYPPRLEIGRIAWKDSHLALVDESVDPPVRLTVDPVGFELTGLVVGGEPGADPPPAHFLARAVAPGIFDELKLEGQVATKLGAIDAAADLVLSGSGVQGKLLAPYLRDLGIEPALSSGTVGMQVRASIRRDAGWRCAIALSQGVVADGGAPIVALGELRVDDAVLDASGLSIGRIAVVEPYARVERAAASGLRAGGLRFVGVPEASKTPGADEPSGSRGRESLAFPELPPVKVREASISGARVAWRDETIEPPVETELRFDGSATSLDTTGGTGRVTATLHVPESVEAVEVSGDVVLSSAGLRVAASVSSHGIRAGPLMRLLPPGTSFEYADGRFGVGLEAELAPAPAGGIRARFAAKDLSWRDGGSPPSLACERIALDVPRIDLAAGVVSIGPAAVEGLSIDAARDERGALHLLGLRIEDAPPRARTVAMSPQTAGAESPRLSSGEAAAAGGEAKAAPRSTGPSLAEVELAGDLSFALERFAFADASLGADARPLEVRAGFRVAGPCKLLDATPSELPPIQWSADAAIAGLLERCEIAGTLSPWAAEPALSAVLSGSGVRTQGVVEFVPALAPHLRGDVENGTLEGRFEATLAVRRTSARDLGLSRSFGADLRAEGLAFRREAGGEILAGVDGIAADVQRVDLEKKVVHVKTLEITTPRGLARRTGTELSAFGLALDLSPKEPAAGGTTAPEPDDELARAPKEPTAESAEPEDAFDVRVDRILASGIAAELRDETKEPPVSLPLAGLDVDVRGFTTRGFRERVPIRFQAIVTAGAPVSGGTALTSVDPIFDEIALSGRVALAPKREGWTSLVISGVELPDVVRLAPPQSVTVSDGALDLRVRAKLDGGATRVQSNVVFSDLDVKEPSGGPVESGLALPMTLDAALFLLRNPAGEHRFSVGFTVDEGSVGTGQIALAATGAFAQVLAVAIAGAPLRLVGAVIPGADGAVRGPRAVCDVPFSEGSCEPRASTAQELFDLQRELAANPSLALVIRHELGKSDVERAEERANPPAEECAELVARARQRKAELLRERAVAGKQARALLAVGSGSARDACARVAGLDRELASVEDSVDRVLEIERTRSPRQERKRTRTAALEIAHGRLESVTQILRSGLEPDAWERLDVREPRFEIAEGGGGGRVVVELRPR